MKRTTLFLVALICLLVGGCTDRPTDEVHAKGNMRIYAVKMVDKEKGKFEYWVTDATTNWLFLSDDKFNVGDSVSIKKNTEN